MKTKTNMRYISLLTGVSIAALGVTAMTAAPALAAPHDTLPDGVYPGGTTTSDTIEICDLATPPGSPCFFGEISTGSPVENANLNSFASGQINQFPGTGTATMSNPGTAEFGAIASATNGAGNATANATAENVAWQTGGGAGSVDYLIDNEGWLLFNAVANAAATGTTGNAFASAQLNGSFGGVLFQSASATGDVSLSVSNDGLLEFVASANAVAPTTAIANASVTNALGQQGVGGTVAIDIENSGTLNVVANAFASGADTGNPFNSAYATVSNAIVQSATGDSGASANLTNTAGGLIAIEANASALNGNANAYANVTDAIGQSVSASSGSAVADIVNDGTMTIGAAAVASGNTSIDAVAVVNNAISQNASALSGDAMVGIDNNGLISISGFASGLGASGSEAEVTAQGTNLIYQNAFAIQGTGAGTNVASVNLNNAAGATIAADFTAIAINGGTGAPAARASAGIDGFLSQNATGWAGADASVSLVNGGLMSVNAIASADGVFTNGTTTVAGYASANAQISNAFVQNASAKSGADASNSIVNDGTISILASANAAGGTSAFAQATNYRAIAQSANATDDGNAVNSISNGGLINIAAVANAVATAPATASAYNTSAIVQYAAATGTGDASNSLTNAGTIAVLASANATDPSYAYAYAYVANAISQSANASGGGDAINNLTNVGTIDISGVANANASTGYASAHATVSSGINQYADADGGGDASSLITNSAGALIAIDANAVANGFDTADAGAYVGTGIYQSAAASGGGAALASLTNAGTIAISANASANAAPLTVITSVGGYSTGSAYAHATIGTGISQVANATNVAKSGVTTVGGSVTFAYSGTAVADAGLVNSGNLDVGASAFAAAYDAAAYAGITEAGIRQDVQAVGGTAATANASLVNSGAVGIEATAIALGTGGATATAYISTGISQSASAFVKEGVAIADASLDNSGSITVGVAANAVASGTDPLGGGAINGNASAYASIGTGIYQGANALGLGIGTIPTTATTAGIILAPSTANASVSLDNSGTIDVAADAAANGSDAFASASISAGVVQSANALAVSLADASAQLNNDGAISVGAGALATATDDATAVAYVGTGIGQFANATGIGTAFTGTTTFAKSGTANAAVGLTNSGTIDITADAFASGGSFGGGFATVSQGVVQVASANGGAGTASATLANSGDLNIGADASATGAVAVAGAFVGTGILQGAYAADSANASIDNSGSIAITAEADAGGEGSFFASANAVVGVGISQSATAYGTSGVAAVSLDNSGSILISADADGALASDGSAFAVGVVGTGIYQYASASSQADVSLNNSGALDVLGVASATADDDATAIAGVSTVIYQSANAYGTGGNASATLTNSGSLTGMAAAQAIGGDDVFADAFVGGIQQFAFGGTTGTAGVSLTNSGPLTMTAEADAIGGGDGTALAFAVGGTQVASAAGGASASLSNTDTIAISASADVLVGNAAQKGADASAVATAYGFYQVASARTGSFTGTATFTTGFTATAPKSATMTGVGFYRSAMFTDSPSGPANASYVNQGSLSVTADASAIGDDTAFARAIAIGTTQVADGTSAVATMVNDGSMDYSASAFASGDNGANATAVAVGFHQYASAAEEVFQTVTAGVGTIHNKSGTELIGIDTSAQRTLTYSNTPVGPALASITNTGSFNVAANASAIAGGNDGPVAGTTAPAFASAFAEGMHQAARGSTATAVIDNSGSISVSANAEANGAAAATAIANATGINQTANAVAYNSVINQHFETVTATTTFGHTFTYQTFVNTGTAFAATPVGPATVLFDNSGSLDVSAVASAVAGGAAFASANATGVDQIASGTEANATVINSGDIDVLASAFASGTAATASANAVGIRQSLFGTAMNASLDNSGSINVAAVASAVMPAFANATGYQVSGTGGGTLSMAVVNSGDLNVSASAVDPLGTAVANAIGMDIGNAPTGTTTLLGSPITGSLTNSGTIDVLAFASGTASTANATGISIMGGVNTMTVTNSGSLFVDAIAANGGSANATGLVVGTNGAVTPAAGDLFVFTNDDGNIVVRQSNDGGATWDRGMAIDVASAPNNSVINLLGDGSIYGNIDVQDGDTIFVENGVTMFDGIINPECMPPAFDDAAKSACGQGTLTIRNNGNLYLVDGNDSAAMDDGPSYVFVDTFNMGATGTIWFELNPTAGGTQPIGTYPQVFADVANLDGTLVADIGLGTLLPADSYFWNNVIDANVRNGTFDACIAMGLPGAGLDSLFLNGTGAGGDLCIYDAQNNVDLGIERQAFNAVGGLTANQQAVADAIEGVYAPSLTGPFANLLVQMFNFEDGDAADYADALDMLSGVEYPNYLHAVRNNTFVLNSFVSDQMDCAIHIRGVDECRSPETRGRLWVKGTYNSAELDSNPNYIGYEADSWSAMIGGDVTFSNFRLGAFAGYRDIDVSYPDAISGNGIKADGFQAGIYGAYDVGDFYVRAIGSYSWLGGESQRRIELFDISTTATGQPDVNVLSIYGEAGARFDLGGSWLTPFVAIDYTSLDLQGFSETNGAGAGLQIDDQTESQTSGIIGLKWAGNWGGITPEAKVAYRHDFSGDLGVDMRFVDAPAGSDFRKVEEYNDGSFIAGLSLAGSMGSSLTGRIGYQGRFNDDLQDHAIYGALTFLFGAAPPPPPPPVAAPPAPPPAPATQTCPDGTVVLATEVCPAPPPPPPPPPPMPERG